MLACSARAGIAASACQEALARHAVCEPANIVALDAMRSANLEAVSVIQEVDRGALVVFAASQPSTLDVSTQVLPLSLSKVFLAASWWDHKQPDLLADALSGKSVDLHEMLAAAATRLEGKWHSPFVRPSARKQCSPIFGDMASTAPANRFGVRSIPNGESG
jgi:hypothetical protein